MVRVSRILMAVVVGLFVVCGIHTSACAQTAISYGDTVESTIDPYDEVEEYTFAGGADDAITVRFAKNSGRLYLKAELYDANDTLLTSSTSGQLDETLSNTENHTIKVFTYSGTYTGNYSLSLQSVTDPGQATALSFGQSRGEELSLKAEILTYTISADADDTIAVRTAKEIGGPAYLNPYLELFNLNGTRISYVTNGVMDKTVNATATYCLLLTDGGRNGDGYLSLSIQRTNNASEATELSYGQTTANNITQSAGMESYTFEANASDTLTFRIARHIDEGTYFTPTMDIYAPNGTQIGNPACIGRSCSYSTQVASDGEYCLLVTDYGFNGLGNYSLTTQRLNNPAGYTELEFGDTEQDIIDAPATIDTFVFAANASDKLIFQIGEVSEEDGYFDFKLELYNQTGGNLVNSTNDTLTYTLPSAQNYSVLVTDSGMNGVGFYDVTLQRSNNPGNLEILAYNTTSDGDIDHFSQMYAYRITANASENITICSDERYETDGIFDTHMELFNDSGVLLDDEKSSLQYTFASAGTYYILMSDYAHNGIGGYRFKVVQGNFSCTEIDLVEPDVYLRAPDEGEIIESGHNYSITWDSDDRFEIDRHDVYLSTDSGLTYNITIASNLSGGSGSYTWSVPANLSTTRARINVTATDGQKNTGFDTNNGDFIIINTTLPANMTNMTYRYDAGNRLVESSDGTTTCNYTYDALGNRLNLTTY